MSSLSNKSNRNVAAPNAPFFTPLQDPPAGAALDPQPNGKPLPLLFQKLKIRDVEFQNRIFLSPLCQYSGKDGFATPWHFAHLGGILTRGPGLTFTEATAVLPNGRISPQDLGLWSTEHMAPLRHIVEFAHSQNQKIGIQLAHAGRKSSSPAPWIYSYNQISSREDGGWPDEVVGPSPISFKEGPVGAFATPKELTREEIKGVVKAFAEAAARAVEIGFDVIEIHSAHGYLLSQFLNPTSNKRTDEYGGSFENRVKLVLEVVDEVRRIIPEGMPLFLRISGTAWLEEVAPNEPQWRSEDTVRIAPLLFARGVDLLDVSAGGVDSRQRIRTGPEYQVPFAAAVKKNLLSPTSGPQLLVSAVGGLYDGPTASRILDEGRADVIFVGRHFQKNPGLVWTMADQLGVQLHVAHQTEWAFRGRPLNEARKPEGVRL